MVSVGRQLNTANQGAWTAPLAVYDLTHHDAPIARFPRIDQTPPRLCKRESHQLGGVTSPEFEQGEEVPRTVPAPQPASGPRVECNNLRQVSRLGHLAKVERPPRREHLIGRQLLTGHACADAPQLPLIAKPQGAGTLGDEASTREVGDAVVGQGVQRAVRRYLGDDGAQRSLKDHVPGRHGSTTDSKGDQSPLSREADCSHLHLVPSPELLAAPSVEHMEAVVILIPLIPFVLRQIDAAATHSDDPPGPSSSRTGLTDPARLPRPAIECGELPFADLGREGIPDEQVARAGDGPGVLSPPAPT